MQYAKTIIELHDETSSLIEGIGIGPVEGSRADIDIRTYRRSESMLTAYSQAGLLIEVTADQLMAFWKTISEPAQSIAPWTCARNIVESSALACWLLDTEIEANERVRRSLAFRYEGVTQMAKYSKAMRSQGLIQHSGLRIKEIERVAASLGFVKSRGFTSQNYNMPSITTLVNKMLDQEPYYRLLSAMTHAHHWAIRWLSLKEIEPDPAVYATNYANIRTLEKHLDLKQVKTLCQLVVHNFCLPLWAGCIMFGWSSSKLINIFEKTYKKMDFEQGTKFWKYPQHPSSAQ